MALSKERLEGLIARSTDIVVATDAKGMVAYYNDGAKRSLGYSQDEILGRYVAQLFPSLDEAKRGGGVDVRVGDDAVAEAEHVVDEFAGGVIPESAQGLAGGWANSLDVGGGRVNGDRLTQTVGDVAGMAEGARQMTFEDVGAER